MQAIYSFISGYFQNPTQVVEDNLNTPQNVFKDWPNEILENVFMELRPEQLPLVKRVNKQWYALVTIPRFKKNILEKYFFCKDPNPQVLDMQINWLAAWMERTFKHETSTQVVSWLGFKEKVTTKSSTFTLNPLKPNYLHKYSDNFQVSKLKNEHLFPPFEFLECCFRAGFNINYKNGTEKSLFFKTLRKYKWCNAKNIIERFESLIQLFERCQLDPKEKLNVYLNIEKLEASSDHQVKMKEILLERMDENSFMEFVVEGFRSDTNLIKKMQIFHDHHKKIIKDRNVIVKAIKRIIIRQLDVQKEDSFFELCEIVKDIYNPSTDLLIHRPAMKTIWKPNEIDMEYALIEFAKAKDIDGFNLVLNLSTKKEGFTFSKRCLEKAFGWAVLKGCPVIAETLFSSVMGNKELIEKSFQFSMASQNKILSNLFIIKNVNPFLNTKNLGLKIEQLFPVFMDYLKKENPKLFYEITLSFYANKHILSLEKKIDLAHKRLKQKLSKAFVTSYIQKTSKPLWIFFYDLNANFKLE